MSKGGGGGGGAPVAGRGGGNRGGRGRANVNRFGYGRDAAGNPIAPRGSAAAGRNRRVEEFARRNRRRRGLG